MKQNLEGLKINHWLIISELGNGKILCQCDCEDKTQKVLDKYSVKSGKSKSCGCVNSFKKLKGQKIGYWTVLEDIDNKKALCKCTCGTIKIVDRAHLCNGTSLSCGCMRGILSNNDEGEKYNYLTIIKELGGGRVLCKCDCGSVKEYYKFRVKNGTTKSCGCKSNELKAEANLVNLENKIFNEWTILKELGKGKVLCRCSCGKESINEKYAVTKGITKSCGHNVNKFIETEGTVFGNWTVLKELGHGYIQCRCSCGKVDIIQKQTLLSGRSKSCGCNQYDNFKNTALARYGEIVANRFNSPREQWQIEAAHSRDKLVNIISEQFNYKPTIYELSKLLGINNASVGRIIKELDVEKYVNIRPLISQAEKDIYNYIRSIYNGEIEQSNRKILQGKELDIYLPEKKIAIEFNGNYWHSDIYKDKNYHKEKTLDCAKQGIRLIHIFEYELDSNKIKIEQYLKNILSDKNRVYARKTEVKEIDKKEAYEFLDKYHIQGRSNAEINLGILSNNELISVMSFGKPRFNTNYQYELIRYSSKCGITVVGGAEKLFKYFVNNYEVTNIITYADISKFTGNIYLKLGFKLKTISEPNYVWISFDVNNVLSRYQTQKHILIEHQLGTEDMTEYEIMTNNGYYRVFDSGNLVLTYSK